MLHLSYIAARGSAVAIEASPTGAPSESCRFCGNDDSNVKAVAPFTVVFALFRLSKDWFGTLTHSHFFVVVRNVHNPMKTTVLFTVTQMPVSHLLAFSIRY